MSTNVEAVSRRQRFYALRENASARRLGAFIAGGLLLALMTGPHGSNAEPTRGFTGSWFHARVIGFIAVAVAAWALTIVRERYSTNIRQFSDSISMRRVPALRDPRTRYVFYAVLVAIAIFYPQTLSGYWQRILVDQIGLYVLLALGLNVVIGLAGLLDLGYIAFFAIGAYTTAYFTGALPVHPPFHLNPFWVFPIATAVAMLSGVILGSPTLRLRGDYLAIVTLGFGEIIQIVARNLTSVTGGADGVINVPHFSINFAGIHYQFTLEDLPYYYLLLIFVVVSMVGFYLLENSRVGRAWTAIREDEVAAEASGINVLKYKILAFAIGASTSGFAGVIFASKNPSFDPDAFPINASILILILVIFGGMGSLFGAVIGAAVLQWAPAFLQNANYHWYDKADLYVYYGALLVVMMIFRPIGIIPSRRRRREIRLAEHGIGTADGMSSGPTP